MRLTRRAPMAIGGWAADHGVLTRRVFRIGLRVFPRGNELTDRAGYKGFGVKLSSPNSSHLSLLSRRDGHEGAGAERIRRAAQP